MNTREDSSMKAEMGMVPVLIKPKKYPFEVSILGWLIIFGMTCFNLYGAVQFFFSTGDIWTLIIFLVLFPYFLNLWLDSRRRKHRAIFLESYQFPSAIKHEVGKHYPHLSDEQLSLVLQGLRQYFQLCNAAGRQMVSMPSRVVDVAWHEFILLTRSYAEFCKNGMGRFLHHTPAVAITSPTSIADGLKKAWLLACEWEEIKQKSPSRLPFLFAIDTALDISDGFKYSLDNDYATEESGGGDDVGCGGGCGGGG